MSIRLFISYAHPDEVYKDKLVKFLSAMKRQGIIDLWTDREITVGEQWDDEIKKGLQNSNVILFLISSDFMASDYINDVEIAEAIRRHKAGEVTIVPVIIRPSDFTSLPLKKFQALPKNALPISKWQNEDEAFMDVVNGLKILIKKMASPTSEPGIKVASGNPENNNDNVIFHGSQLRNYIAQNKTDLAIKELMQYTGEINHPLNQQVILQSGKFQELKKNKLMGLWAFNEITLYGSQINVALLEIISELEAGN